jgi:pyruvate/2-oxoglutarate dehydrogenase complex dihydrolipoamide dehydrogenase (E3) component
VDFKYDLDSFLQLLVSRVEKLGVNLMLGTEATPELVDGLRADAVFAAVGSDPLRPPVPGADGLNVVTAEDCFGRLDRIGRKVVVVGGGEVGCETALYLANGGKDVAVLEMRDGLALDSCYAPWLALNDRVSRAAKVYLNARASRISDESVYYIEGNCSEKQISADTVVLSAGMRARESLAESFRDCAPLFFRIGDCLTPKNIRICTRTAYDAAMSL